MKKIKNKILITGCAGFIGYHFTKLCMADKYCKIIGIDNLNKYYSVKLKTDRIKDLKKYNLNKNFIFKKIDINNYQKLFSICKKYKINQVINLAAQAGVRHVFKRPKDYFNSNLLGFFNILEVCRNLKIKELLYASTSSVYGDNKKMPFVEKHDSSSPIQFYAATKKCNEVMAHSYAKMFGINSIGVRFFTVYGSWGRPDMSIFKFTKNIIEKKNIEIFNYGNHLRDFTHVSDIVHAIYKLSKKIKKGSNIFNIGNNKQVKLMDMIKILEKTLNKKSKKTFKPLQDGDIKATHSSTKKLYNYIGYKSKTDIQAGIKEFLDWYLQYTNVKL
jgi:UDP-glucuronate 4-epimerase